MEINEDYVWEILKLSKDMFSGNLYIKCNEHPCGWDRIDMEDIVDIDDTVFDENISNGIYNFHPYNNLTLYEIIEKVGMNGWSFVPPTICPDDFNTIGI